EVIRENPSVVDQIKGGKPSAMGFLVGQAMKKMKIRVNPKKLNEIMTRRIQNV
ncbi:MAG: Asp-tRNA(Asn)/Glu-tRNA(Gln) amidotransferase GatCAB subunit B, partial [Candidatus Omnitrophica bacterium]|nr:Asp-tRNA(Asn)/Glu-tRNA(Gln) amidotransferase GatCAB subunit B [Candidatus Omnitrophota bacterium]